MALVKHLTALPKDRLGSRADLPAAVVIAISVGALVAVLLVTAATTLRARLNVVQAAAALFFLVVAVRHARARSAEVPDRPRESKCPLGLWLSLLIGAATWAVMVPFYFIGDDFEHLAGAKGPMFAGLWELTIRGQQGAFLRPVGFASIFLDYRFYGTWPAGYHLTNLIIHLACVGGVYYLSSELRVANRFHGFADL
jgi:hypothetical protein